jgi:hypothetical protein
MTRASFVFVTAIATMPVQTVAVPSGSQEGPEARLDTAVSEALLLLSKPSVTAFTPDQQLAWKPIAFVEARRHLFEIRTTLLNKLQGDPGFDALRAYVELNFPDFAPDDVLQYGWAPEGGVVAEASYESVLNSVRQFLRKLNGLSPLVVGVIFSTSPPGARVTIHPVLGTRSREVLTDGEFVNVYRGLYEFRIVKAGFETFTGELDLVDDSRTAITCTIIKQSSTDSEPGCTRSLRSPRS